MTCVLSKEEQLERKYWEGLHTISSHEVDFRHHLSLNMLFGLFQEAAYQHVKTISLGWKDLHTKHLAWILSRVKLVILRLPVWEEDIRIRTWSAGTNGVIANRNWEVTDMDDNVIISGTSNWLIINENTRKISRIDKKLLEPYALSINYQENNLDKIPVICDFKLLSEFETKNNEIDVNYHVNNTNYIKWVIDAEEFSFLEAHTPNEVEINYLHEVRAGSVMAVKKHIDNNNDTYYSIYNCETESARIRVKWSRF